MLQCSLVQLLENTSKISINTVPVIEVQSVSAGEEHTPFTFTPHTLRLHTHEDFFEDGDVYRHLYLQDLVTPLAEESQTPNVAEFRCHISGCKQVFDCVEGYELHYNSLHRHVCSTCRRSFPSNRLLDIHILEWHDSLFQILAEKQSMYECLVEGCGLKFQSSRDRKDHLIRVHSYPADFRFDRTKKIKSQTKEQKTPHQKDVCPEASSSPAGQQEVPETCESMDVSLPQESASLESEQLKPRYTYKVPPSVCFGQGAVRGFRGRRKKK